MDESSLEAYVAQIPEKLEDRIVQVRCGPEGGGYFITRTGTTKFYTHIQVLSIIWKVVYFYVSLARFHPVISKTFEKVIRVYSEMTDQKWMKFETMDLDSLPNFHFSDVIVTFLSAYPFDQPLSPAQYGYIGPVSEKIRLARFNMILLLKQLDEEKL